MPMPAMGNSTPKVKKAVEDAECVCPTDSHRYGYMISVAQGLELRLQERELELVIAYMQLLNRCGAAEE